MGDFFIAGFALIGSVIQSIYKGLAVRLLGSTSGYWGFAVPAVSPSVTLTMPTAAPTVGQVLVFAADGTGTWGTPVTSVITQPQFDLARTNLVALLGALRASTTTEFGAVDSSPPSVSTPHSGSTFAGWGSAVGQPAPFNRVETDIVAWDILVPVTECKLQIREVNSAGAILATCNIGVYPLDTFTSFRAVFDLGTTITPTGNLWLEFFTNGHAGCRPTAAYAFTTGAGYPSSQYTTDQTISGTPSTVVNFASENVWFRFSTSDTTYVYESGPLGTVTGTGSSVYGFGGPIGTPAGFNRIEFDIVAWNIFIIPTMVRMRLFTVNQAGTLLAEKTVAVNVFLPAGNSSTKTYRVIVDLDTPIANAAGSVIWCDFQSDGIIATRQSTSVLYSVGGGYSIGKSASTPLAVYAGPATWANLGTNFNSYVKCSNVAVSALRLAGVDDALNLFKQLDSRIHKPEILLPLSIYAVEGHELNVYFPNILKTTFPASYQAADFWIDVLSSGSFGIQENERWTYAPIAADVTSGSNLQFSVYDQGILVAQQTPSLVVKAAKAVASVTRKIVTIGDSTTAGGELLSELTNLCNVNRSSPGLIESITSSGTTATVITTYPHGLATSDVIAGVFNASPAGYNRTAQAITRIDAYTFTYALAGSLATPATVSDNTNGKKIYFTSGADNLTINTVGTIAVSANDAQGTSRSVSTDAISGKTIAFYYSDALSPFVNPVGGAFDFAYYLSHNSISLAANDWILIHLGINDITAAGTDAAVYTAVLSMQNQLSAMLLNIQSVVSGIRVGLLVTIPSAASQDAFGVSYGSLYIRYRQRRNRDIWIQELNRIYGDMVASKVWVVPFGMGLDTENNFPVAYPITNSRNLLVTVRQNNGVHPQPGTGYFQLADMVYYFLRGQET